MYKISVDFDTMVAIEGCREELEALQNKISQFETEVLIAETLNTNLDDLECDKETLDMYKEDVIYFKRRLSHVLNDLSNEIYSYRKGL